MDCTNDKFVTYEMDFGTLTMVKLEEITKELFGVPKECKIRPHWPRLNSRQRRRNKIW